MGTTAGGTVDGTGHGRDGDVDLARRASAGDSDAFGQLFERWFDRAFDVAWHVVHNRDTAADVAQETFATAWQRIGQLRQPESFGGWLLRITRNTALNRLQREQRSRPVGEEPALVDLQASRTGAAADAAEPLLDQERDTLVWAAAAALGEEDASLLSLHLRHGLEPAELAEELGVQANAAHQRLFRLRKRLGDAIGAWVLWRRGTPSCPQLATALTQLDRRGFDRTTAQAIWRHTRTCDDCESTRQLRLDPGTLFAAIPLVVAPPALRAKAVSALQAQGIPVGGGAGPGPTSGQPPGDGPGPSDGHAEPPGDSSAPGDQAHQPGPGDTGLDQSPGDGDLGHTPDDGSAASFEQTEPFSPSDDLPDPAAAEELPGPSGPTAARSGRSRALRRALAGAAAVLAVIVALLLASNDGTGDDDTPAVADDDRSLELPGRGDSSTTTSSTVSTTTSTTSPPSTEDPPDTTATTAPTTAATPPPTDTTPPTEPLPDPPTIGGFRASRGRMPCDLNQLPTIFVWNTTGADEVTLGPTGGAASAVDGSSTERCTLPGSQWTLTATNPAGSTTATVTTPSAPTP